MKLSILTVAALVLPATAFSPQPPKKVPAHVAVERSLRRAGAAAIAASTILSNVIVPLPSASAADDAFYSSTQVISARSGGRAGGRSSAPRRSAAPARAPTRVIERQTTVIQQAPAPMYASPGFGYAQPAAPSGLGLAIGLNAVSGIASGMREARQENEIRSTRDQLTEARIKEAEMEARLRGLEQQQMMQQMQGAK